MGNELPTHSVICNKSVLRAFELIDFANVMEKTAGNQKRTVDVMVAAACFAELICDSHHSIGMYKPPTEIGVVNGLCGRQSF